MKLIYAIKIVRRREQLTLPCALYKESQSVRTRNLSRDERSECQRRP